MDRDYTKRYCRHNPTNTSGGRLGWTDEIDFDINSELASNSYLNNDAFLSLSSALTILKHEIPSPSSEPQKNGTQHPMQQKNNNAHDSVNDAIQHQQQQLQQQCSVADIVGLNGHAATHSNSNSNDQLPQSQHMQQSAQPQLHQSSGPFKGLSASAPALESTNATNGQQQTDNSGQEIGQNAAIAATSSSAVKPSAIVDKPIGEQSKFQYVLAASTSIATKTNEDTLTYLNQGQSYEIKLKKLGDLSAYRGKMLKSIIKICFHERRLQYMEREQMLLWQQSRPGERIVEIDVPLSYGLCQVAQSAQPQLLNTVDVLWDPMKEVGVYIQVNCISTEFTPKKHGGEKGVPFRIQVETYLDGGHGGKQTGGILSGIVEAVPAPPPPLKLIHAAACQIKVFKLKGADRKHKQDREKIQKRTASEQEKYQPSYECTILTDIPNESIVSAAAAVAAQAMAAATATTVSAVASPTSSSSPSAAALAANAVQQLSQTCYSPDNANHAGGNSPPFSSTSPVHTTNMFIGNGGSSSVQQAAQSQQQQQAAMHPIGINSVSSSNSNGMKMTAQQQQQQQQQQQAHNMIDQCLSQSLSPRQIELADESIPTMGQDSSPTQLLHWLNHHRLGQHAATFAHFAGADLLRMSKEDIIQICGVADGIRMYNTIHSKAITPRLTIYVSFDGTLYHAVYLHASTTLELSQKLCRLPGFAECAQSSRGGGGGGGGGGGSASNDANVFSSWSNCQPAASKYGASNSSPPTTRQHAIDAARLAVYVNGPAGIQVLVTDEVLDNIKDDALFAVEFQAGGAALLMKAVYKNESAN